MMLIGCLEREFLKNGLNSDVNSKLKSDLIAGNNFSGTEHLFFCLSFSCIIYLKTGI